MSKVLYFYRNFEKVCLLECYFISKRISKNPGLCQGTGWRRSDRPTGQQSEDSTTESTNSCMVDEAVVICSSLVADELRMMTVDGAMSIDDAFGRRVHQQINLGRLVVLFGRSSRKQRRARRMCSGRADSADSALSVDTNLARSGPLV